MMKQISDSEGEDMAFFCGYCGEEISWKRTGKRTGKRNWTRRRFMHINICQEPSTIYFCNRECKLNWIFKSPDVELDKDLNNERVKVKVKPSIAMADVEENTKELEKYLKDNKIKILRQA